MAVVRAAARGDQSAFAALIGRYDHRLRRVGPVEGGFRWATLEQPITLTARHRYIVASAVSTRERFMVMGAEQHFAPEIQNGLSSFEPGKEYVAPRDPASGWFPQALSANLKLTPATSRAASPTP
jgi:hypothetical protein